MEESRITELVLSAYDKIAEKYKLSYDEIDRQDWEHWEKFITECSGGKILDMGCGAGSATVYLWKRGLVPYGIDISEKMLSIARKQNKEIVWEKADLCDCPFEDRSFKGIIVSYTLNHLNDHMTKKMKAEIDRLLEDNGLLLLMFHVGTGEEVRSDPLDDSIQVYYHYFSRESLNSLFYNYEEIDYYSRKSVSAEELENDKAVIVYRKR